MSAMVTVHVNVVSSEHHITLTVDSHHQLSWRRIQGSELLRCVSRIDVIYLTQMDQNLYQRIKTYLQEKQIVRTQFESLLHCSEISLALSTSFQSLT